MKIARPLSERPREKTLQYGISSLTDIELLALLIRSGSNNIDVYTIATNIIDKYQSIANLETATISSLQKIKGIGLIKAIEITAIIEIAKRIYCPTPKLNKKLSTAKEIWLNCKYLFVNLKQENFYCLYFDNKQNLIATKLLFKGTINKSVVHPREIFKEAYLLSATSIICIHNHPSGDVTPSKEDIEFTVSIKKIGELQKIPVIDHIIVANDKYYSFYDSCL